MGAGLLFVVGVVLSLDALALSLDQLRWWLLALVAVVGTAATIAVNAAELRAMVACVEPGRRIGWWEATRVVVVATAANILPVPGGAVVRIHTLHSPRTGLRAASLVTALAAVLWVAAAVALAGVGALGTVPALGALALVAGLAGMVGAGVLLQRVGRPCPWSTVAWLAVVEVITTLLHALRLWLVLLGLGLEASFVQALVLAAAAPVAAAAGVFPSGLGLAELLSALLAPLAGLTAAAGLTATAVARVLGLVTTAPLALALGVRDLTGGAATAEEPSGTGDAGAGEP